MVNEGWDFETLMDMSVNDFAYWADQQDRRNKAVAEAAAAKRNKAKS